MHADNTTLAIFGLIAWTLLLLISIAMMRTGATLTAGRDANSFTPDGDDLSPFSGRLCRAHANCYEFLPFALAAMLYAVATDQTAVTNGLALIVLAARLGQSIVHILSKSNLAVMLRFAFLLPQIGIVLYWAAKFTFL
jgi:uncharacterized MAPEG superfamily protein